MFFYFSSNKWIASKSRDRNFDNVSSDVRDFNRFLASPSIFDTEFTVAIKNNISIIEIKQN